MMRLGSFPIIIIVRTKRLHRQYFSIIVSMSHGKGNNFGVGPSRRCTPIIMHGGKYIFCTQVWNITKCTEHFSDFLRF